MIFVAFIILCFILSLLFGGRFENLARVHLRHAWLILLSLGIQIVIFSAWWHEWAKGTYWKEMLYILSLLLLLVAVWMNRHVAGLPLIGLGLLLNSLVIAVNGGRMPASLRALQLAGIADSEAAFEAMRTANSTLIKPGTPLWFLGDIFAVPRQIPFANVFSIGDIALGLGGAVFLYDNMQPPKDAAS